MIEQKNHSKELNHERRITRLEVIYEHIVKTADETKREVKAMRRENVIATLLIPAAVGFLIWLMK